MWSTTKMLPILHKLVDDIAFSSDRCSLFKDLPQHTILIDRPGSLSTDEAEHKHVLVHSLEYMEHIMSKHYDYVMLLQPTNPLRTEDNIRNAVAGIEHSNVDLLRCFYKDNNLDLGYVSSEPASTMYDDSIGKGVPVIASGAVYMFKCTWIRDNFRLFGSETQMEIKKCEGYNINVEEDFGIAEALMKERDGNHNRDW